MKNGLRPKRAMTSMDQQDREEGRYWNINQREEGMGGHGWI